MPRSNGTPEPSAKYEYESSPIKQPVIPPTNLSSRTDISNNAFPHFRTRLKQQQMLDRLLDGDECLSITHPAFKGDVYEYLNEVSELIRDAIPQKARPDYVIRFEDKGDKCPSEHPTGSKCRPDLVAFKVKDDDKAKGDGKAQPIKDKELDLSHLVDNAKGDSTVEAEAEAKDDTEAQPVENKTLPWSHLVAVGEKLSKGTKLPDATAQAAAYSEFLLQARPDLLSVPGIYFSDKEFTIFHTDACQIYHTGIIKWDSVDIAEGMTQKLLRAWVQRLYGPHLDKTITFNDETNLFTIDVGKEQYSGLRIIRVGLALGRRTTIFAAEGEKIVIKEQYVEKKRRFKEGPMLHTIHKNRTFPGVVQCTNHGPVIFKDNPITVEFEDVKREKMRLVLQDRGSSLMEVKTPREFLMALYDLLEITRMLWRKHKILHRDISDNNILIHPESFVPKEPLATDFDEMCFSEHLLKKPVGEGNPSDQDPSSRLKTRVLLIDFDMSEDQTPREHNSAPTGRTGTALFMARVLRTSRYPIGAFDLPPMPELEGPCLDMYKQLVPSRWKEFPPNGRERIEIGTWVKGAFEPKPDSPFRHKLHYDAESTFWLFLWWAVNAQPADFKDSYIEKDIWSWLTSDKDARNNNFINEFPSNILHPKYRNLESLLRNMSKHLKGELDCAKNEHRKKEEYLHEVFQRLILQFIFVNDGKDFMNLKKGEKNRPVENRGGMSPVHPTTETKGSKRSSDTTDPRPSKKSKPNDSSSSHLFSATPE